MQDTVVERDAIQDQVKVSIPCRDFVFYYAFTSCINKYQTPFSLSLPIQIIGDGIDGVKKERQAVRSKIKVVDNEMKVVDGEIALLQEDLNAATARKDKAYESLTELRKLCDLAVSQNTFNISRAHNYVCSCNVIESLRLPHFLGTLVC